MARAMAICHFTFAGDAGRLHDLKSLVCCEIPWIVSYSVCVYLKG